MSQLDFNRRRVLVTGGAGFIGSHLVDRLLELGAEVRVLDNLSTGDLANLDHCRSKIDLIEGDIRDLATCEKSCAGVHVVFHQAALGSVPRSIKDPATTIEVNVSGTANVFSAARDSRAEAIVYASSSSVYGDSEKLPKREGTEGAPLSPYALSKCMCEELADQFWRNFGTGIIGLRYFNVFGPRQSPEGPYAAVIPRFFASALRHEQPTIFGDGEQSRDFTPVAEAVQANLIAASAGTAAFGRAFNVATGVRTTVNALAGEISAITDRALEPKYEDPRAGDVRHSHADLSLAREFLQYEPGTSLSRGLEGCLSYYSQLFC